MKASTLYALLKTNKRQNINRQPYIVTTCRDCLILYLKQLKDMIIGNIMKNRAFAPKYFVFRNFPT